MTENAVEEKSSRRRRRKEMAQAAEAAAAPEPAVTAEVHSPITPGKGRATPGRRTHEEEVKEGNFITRAVNGLREYFSDVRSELEKVSWPTREDAIRLTRIVLIVLVIAAIVMGFINFLFERFVAFGIQNPIVFVVLLAACVGVALWVFRGQNASRGSY
ncbi:preprotein translocase subunit SecE [Aggregatilineales bacterium SYSU G02658]